MAFILLSILYVIIDVHALWFGVPFIYAGILLQLIVRLLKRKNIDNFSKDTFKLTTFSKNNHDLWH